MTGVLGEYVATSRRFSRSTNVERDHGDAAIDGYLPTGRALDVISRIANGLLDPASGRAFSITGPHGGGKSSLAVFLDALLAPPGTAESRAAQKILASIDKPAVERLALGRRVVKAGRTGFIRAFATARNEPVAATVARGLHAGAVRQFGAEQQLVPASFDSPKHVPSAREIRTCISRMTQKQPVLLLIDEFGKNLEHFVTSDGSGDPFLLQEIAEMSQGADAERLLVITMQHLSFDEYVQDSSSARRREWSKVQGRFQDIPYIETPAQSRRLIASVLEQSPELRASAQEWIAHHGEKLETAGLRDIAEDAAEAMPLNPVALMVLPELCSRYGQNERTLFSFMAGSEPFALPEYLANTTWSQDAPLPLAGVDLLYDYFLEASGNMIGVADSASRWLEIETRIRDTAGLTPPQLKLLKTIGLLNLVSSGGRIRASRALIQLAVEHGDLQIDVDEVLESLVEVGLVTYRAFSDEYRIWQGSDYSIRKVVDDARQSLAGADLDVLLSGAIELEPLVAGRHSQRSGVLRVFGRRFSRGALDDIEPANPNWDGIVYYTTNSNTKPPSIPAPEDGRPAIYVIPSDVSEVRASALEAAALRSALKIAEKEDADWVAQRELAERLSAAQQKLQGAVYTTWESDAAWFIAGSGKPLSIRRGLSAVLSDVADIAYPSTPRVANEMIARRELTSQGAKARRFLTDALLESTDLEAFGIQGYGPDRAIYEAIFRTTGIHRPTGTDSWGLHPPTEKSWKPAWEMMNASFDSAVDSRVNLSDISARLSVPPIGLKGGLIPLLLVAVLVYRSDEIALYEHGSLVLALDDAVAERLTKNLNHFSIKNTQTNSRSRSVVIDSLVKNLGISGQKRSLRPTFLNVATALYRELRMLPPYVQKTRRGLSAEAIALRDAFQQATEPDVLVFTTLPEIFGIKPFGGRGPIDRATADRYGDRLAGVIRELRCCYDKLLDRIREQLAEATSASSDLQQLRRTLAADATRLEGHVLEPSLRTLVGALLRPLDGEAWLENVAMVVCEGQAPRVWTDDVAARFPLMVSQLGGALRRTSALLHERLAENVSGMYSASRLTLTQPDGTETIEVLTLTEPEKDLIDPHIARLLDALAESGVQRSAACRMLMARLAEERKPAEARAQSAYSDDSEEKQHG